MNKEELEKELDIIKYNLFIKTRCGGLMGALLCATPIIFVDKIVTEYSTNGEDIKINADFWNTLTVPDKVYLITHCLWHIAFLHMTRLEDREPVTWNIASNIVINNMLIYQENYQYKNLKLIKDSKYLNWSTEQVYKDIYQENKQEEMLSQGSASSLSYELSDKNVDSKVSKEKLINKVNSLKQFNKESLPSEITSFLDKYTKTTINWKTILSNFMSELVNKERNFRKINKRYSNIILPTYNASKGLEKINFYVDTSASVTNEELQVFNNELKKVIQLFEPKEINIICFDTRIRSETKITSFDKFAGLKLNGRGGTCFNAPIEHLKKSKPNGAVFFSDMCIDYVPSNPKIPVIWLCTYKDGFEPNYGKFKYIDLDNYKD